jgi:two-component SAPR family response regulator
MQNAKKAIPLARAMALSTLAGWLSENGGPELAKEAASRRLAENVWEDAFSFSARVTLIYIYGQEGADDICEAHRRELVKYDQDDQFDWSFLPSCIGDAARKLLRGDDDAEEKAKVQVVCFGRFRVRLPGGDEDVRWRTKKAEELFAYLFHLQGRPVDKETILLQLWPEADKESATSLLHTTLYNIRKVLAIRRLDDLIVYEKKKYSMNMGLISSDLSKIDQLCRALSQNDDAFIYNCRELLLNFSGEYLGGVACSFAGAPRTFYEQKYLLLCTAAARESMERRQWKEAISLLDMAIGVDPFEENLYFMLMQCLREIKDVKRAKKYYTRLRDLLRDELDVEPSAEVSSAYRLCMEEASGHKLAVM